MKRDLRVLSTEELVGEKVAVSLHYLENGKMKYLGGETYRVLKFEEALGYYVDFKGKKLPVTRKNGIVFNCEYGVDISKLEKK